MGPPAGGQIAAQAEEGRQHDEDERDGKRQHRGRDGKPRKQ